MEYKLLDKEAGEIITTTKLCDLYEAIEKRMYDYIIHYKYNKGLTFRIVDKNYYTIEQID